MSRSQGKRKVVQEEEEVFHVDPLDYEDEVMEDEEPQSAQYLEPPRRKVQRTAHKDTLRTPPPTKVVSKTTPPNAPLRPRKPAAIVQVLKFEGSSVVQVLHAAQLDKLAFKYDGQLNKAVHSYDGGKDNGKIQFFFGNSIFTGLKETQVKGGYDSSLYNFYANTKIVREVFEGLKKRLLAADKQIATKVVDPISNGYFSASTLGLTKAKITIPKFDGSEDTESITYEEFSARQEEFVGYICNVLVELKPLYERESNTLERRNAKNKGQKQPDIELKWAASFKCLEVSFKNQKVKELPSKVGQDMSSLEEAQGTSDE